MEIFGGLAQGLRALHAVQGVGGALGNASSVNNEMRDECTNEFIFWLSEGRIEYITLHKLNLRDPRNLDLRPKLLPNASA